MTELTEAQKTWGASPTGWTSAKDEAPGTRTFFEKARHFRDSIEQPWLGEVFPFELTKDRRILEVGFGPGYDALKFMQAGAIYSGIDITAENIDRTKKHLGYFGLDPNVVQGDVEHLPYPDAWFDVVYSNGVLHHVPNLGDALQEIRRVLKPGGQMTILMYNRNSVFYAGLVAIQIATGRIFKESLADRRSRIESSAANAKPIVNVYSRTELSKILRANGFEVRRIIARKCNPEDLPGSGLITRFYRLVPQSLYDMAGRLAGWYLVATATRQS